MKRILLCLTLISTLGAAAPAFASDGYGQAVVSGLIQGVVSGAIQGVVSGAIQAAAKPRPVVVQQTVVQRRVVEHRTRTVVVHDTPASAPAPAFHSSGGQIH
jgi:hypothetical protein